MKCTKLVQRADGTRTTTIVLAKGESLMLLRDGAYYKLGGQLDDVVGAHVLQMAEEAVWCSIEQKWRVTS